MAVLPSHYVDEEELTSLKSLVETQSEADDDLIGMEEGFRALLCMAAELEGVEAPLPSDELAWAESLEGAAREAAEAMADEAEGVRRGVAVLALRPGEAATVAALRRHAAQADARRAEAEEVAAAARRLQEKNLRSLAATEHLVDPRCLVVVESMAEVLDSDLGDGCVPTPEEVAAAINLESEVMWMHETMVRLAERLRRGAAAFAARPGEEALVGALLRQAAKADAHRATVEAFTDTVRRYPGRRQLAGCRGRGGG